MNRPARACSSPMVKPRANVYAAMKLKRLRGVTSVMRPFWHLWLPDHDKGVNVPKRPKRKGPRRDWRP